MLLGHLKYQRWVEAGEVQVHMQGLRGIMGIWTSSQGAENPQQQVGGEIQDGALKDNVNRGREGGKNRPQSSRPAFASPEKSH